MTEKFYEEGQYLNGEDVQNRGRAEGEILREGPDYLTRPAIVISIEGVVYTGEYEPLADGYKPGEWSTGAHVRVRLEGEKLYICRPNGQELETTVVKRIG